MNTVGKAIRFDLVKLGLLISLCLSGCGGDDQSSSPGIQDQDDPNQNIVEAPQTDNPPSPETTRSNQNPYEGQSNPIFLDASNWLCHPDLDAPFNSCDTEVDSTFVASDGSAFVQQYSTDPQYEVDCFYVYPTVSDDPTPNSDRLASVQERETTRAQFARYRSVCTAFAPIYTQVTLPFLQARIALGEVATDVAEEANEIAYQDVLSAFKTYINELNNDRPFLLVGHSQGTIHLKRLIAEEVEQHPYLMSRLVAAHLIGFSVEVPKGEDIGGTFNAVPACRAADQSQCVVAFSSYREGDPELPNAVFGRASDPSREALCVNPAELLNKTAFFFDPQIPRILPPLFQAVVKPRGSGGPYANPAMNISFDTYFYSVPEQITGQCRSFNDDVHYLEVSIIADENDPRADDYAAEFNGGDGWGLHLADMNLVLDDLIELAGRQIEQYRSERQE